MGVVGQGVEEQIGKVVARQVLGDRQPLTRRIEDAVLSRADLGLRFYPVLARQYASGSHHPEYLMTIDVRALDFDIDHRTITHPDSDPVIETFVRQVDCSVATSASTRGSPR